jgi:Ca2+-binding RTX toxin-like protein
MLALLALLVPASAQAGTFSKVGTTLLYTGTDADEQLSGYSSGTALIFSTFPAGTTFAGTGCALNLGNIECSTLGYTRYEARGLGGIDRFYGMGLIPATLDGGPGNDILDGAGLGDILIGGEGDDWLRGAAGNDDIRGGSGDDRLEGGPGPSGGADTFSGGDGIDVVNYFYASAGVTVSIDGVANDGEPGEGDNVQLDVENLWGSDDPDTLTGSAGPNSIEGGLGGDTIAGLGGRDELFGEEGNDTILARDGVGEPVECGSGNDTAEVDDSDGSPSFATPSMDTVTPAEA